MSATDEWLKSEHPETIGERLADQARRHGDQTLLTTAKSSLTYADMELTACRVAHGFQQLGIAKADVVCQMMPNCDAIIINWMALAKLGAINAPLNYEFRGDALSRVINLTESRILVLDESFCFAIADIAEDLSHLETIVFRSPDAEFTSDPRLERFNVFILDELDLPGTTPHLAEIHFSDPAMLMFTSGTTGFSKAVEFSHRYALTWASEYIDHWELTEKDVVYSASPLFHADASLLAFMTALLLGSRAVIMPKFSVSLFWKQVRAHQVSVATLLAPIPLFLFNQPERNDDSQNPLRLITTAPMPSFWRVFEQRFNVKLVTAFGQTEVGHPIVAQIHEPHRENTTGKPCRHFEVCIVDEWDEMLPAGVIGEIVVRPKLPFTTMTGYYKDPRATSEVSRNLWHHTGDLGVAREDGYLTYVGRKKDTIRRRGENISPLEVEAVLHAHPDIIEAAVIGVPSENLDEDVKALIVLAPGSGWGPESVATWTKDKLARYAIPRFIEIVSELPRTGTDKVKKSALRASWRNAQTYDREIGGYLEN